MNTLTRVLVCLGGAAPLIHGISARAQSTSSDAKPATQFSVSNAVPQSVFTIPTNAAEGRDPFFPNAHYMFGGDEVKKPVISPDLDTLALKGVSGTLDHPLAMLSHGKITRTLAEGEETTFKTLSGPLRVRCVEIHGESAVVEVDGERRELRLRD
jgi:hypothetical protein